MGPHLIPHVGMEETPESPPSLPVPPAAVQSCLQPQLTLSRCMGLGASAHPAQPPEHLPEAGPVGPSNQLGD